jgi:hypothetical protein
MYSEASFGVSQALDYLFLLLCFSLLVSQILFICIWLLSIGERLPLQYTSFSERWLLCLFRNLCRLDWSEESRFTVLKRDIFRPLSKPLSNHKAR